MKLRLVLDSSDGRHYTDGVLNGVYDGRTPLPAALESCGPPADLNEPATG